MARHLGRVGALVLGMRRTARARGIVAGIATQQARFEAIVESFSLGYYLGLDANTSLDVSSELQKVELPLRGFAYEGAGMALATREALNPWRQPLLRPLIEGTGEKFTYLLHIGAGWTFGWVPFARRVFSDLDPLLRWQAIDGMGFRDFFFASPQKRNVIAATPRREPAVEARILDQGAGRCLWFVAGAHSNEVIRWINSFAKERHSDLWAGIAVAVVYAGEPADSELAHLAAAAATHLPAVGQGAAFAAKALARAGQLCERHDAACRRLCGVTALEAARITDDALVGLPRDATAETYERWRHQIQARIGSIPKPTVTL